MSGIFSSTMCMQNNHPMLRLPVIRDGDYSRLKHKLNWRALFCTSCWQQLSPELQEIGTACPWISSVFASLSTGTLWCGGWPWGTYNCHHRLGGFFMNGLAAKAGSPHGSSRRAWRECLKASLLRLFSLA